MDSGQYAVVAESCPESGVLWTAIGAADLGSGGDSPDECQRQRSPASGFVPARYESVTDSWPNALAFVFYRFTIW